MRRFFLPAVALMNRLRYAHKFLVISALFALPLGLTGFFFISEINSKIAFSQKEMYGNAYLKPLRNLLEHLPQHQRLAHESLAGTTVSPGNLMRKQLEIDADMKTLQEVETLYGSRLDTSVQFQALIASWGNLKEKISHLKPSDSDALHVRLFSDTRAIFSHAGDVSNLILDPDLDTYYMMDAILLSLPELQDLLPQVTVLGKAVTQTKTRTVEEKAKIIILSGLMTANLNARLAGWNVAIQNNPAGNLKTKLTIPLEQSTLALNQFLQLLEKELIHTDQVTLQPNLYTDSADFALQKSFALWDTSMHELDFLLANRIGVFTQRRSVVVTITILFMLLVTYLWIGFYLAVMRTVFKLKAASQGMVNGDLSGLMKLENYDELGQVVVSFNQIATELLKARDEALEATRTKSAFLANMSHELRTPLNAVIGYSDMLTEDAEELKNKVMVADLNRINSAGKHLLLLINDILDISKIEAGKAELYLETAEISNIIDDVVSMVRPLVEKNKNALTTHCPNDIGAIRTDITKFRQILFNLLSNASKFCKQGRIGLDVRRETKEGTDWITLLVSDSGIGITPDQQERLFQAFVQADSSTTRNFGGTGLGLTICRHFCRMMGGDITVDSELGKGTTFTVSLPAIIVDFGKENQDKEAIPKPAKEVQMTVSAGTILVIDDEPNVRDLLKRMLSKQGYHVEVSANGKEGIALAKRLKPNAILLDILMPDMSGWEVLSAIQANPEITDIPVIFISVSDQKKLGYAVGAVDYLTKPIDKTRLLSLLTRYGTGSSLRNVLVVEDDPVSLQMMQRILEKEGCHVEVAENGRIALEKLADFSPQVIFLDLMMPEMDGFEFVDRIQRDGDEGLKKIPIVVITAKVLTKEDHIRLNGYVEKILQKGDFSQDTLLLKVRDAITARIKMPRNL